MIGACRPDRFTARWSDCKLDKLDGKTTPRLASGTICLGDAFCILGTRRSLFWFKLGLDICSFAGQSERGSRERGPKIHKTGRRPRSTLSNTPAMHLTSILRCHLLHALVRSHPPSRSAISILANSSDFSRHERIINRLEKRTRPYGGGIEPSSMVVPR